MNRKRMALAVAGIFAVPAVALAQKSTVEIYGRANLGFSHYQSKGATAGSQNDLPGRFQVFNNDSRVGFRGTEDLGNGLRAIFQIETGVNIDNGSNTGQGGQSNASTGFWASRDSFVGLDSNWGRLTFGRQSFFYLNGVNAQFSANYINTQIPWTDGRQLGRVSLQSAAASRTSNTIQYTSPTFAGMNVTASYSTNLQENQQQVVPFVGVTTTDADGYIFGLTWRGTWGPFYAQADWSTVRGNSIVQAGGVLTPKGDAYKVGGSWGYMPGSRIGLIWTMTDVNNGTGQVIGITTGQKVDQQAFTINWEHTFGPVQVMAQYGWLDEMSGDGCNVSPFLNGQPTCNNSGATSFMVGARYFLSKRTWVYASYNQVSNDANQYVDYTLSSMTSWDGTGMANLLGANPKIWALGLFHAF
jgi:predicted porin